MQLHSEKDYKIETLFVACNIFDRYLYNEGHWNFSQEKFIKLATISILMAAKLEEDTSPSFNRMIRLLTHTEQNFVSKNELVDLEYDIIFKFGFDFNFPGPIESCQRYLRLLDHNKNKHI